MPEPKNKKPKKPKKKPDIDLSKRKLYDKPSTPLPKGMKKGDGVWKKIDPWEAWPLMKKKERNPSGEKEELANSFQRMNKGGHGKIRKELLRMDEIDEGKSTLRLAKTAQDTSDVRTLRDRGVGEAEIFKSFEKRWLREKRKKREKLDKERKGKSNQKKT